MSAQIEVRIGELFASRLQTKHVCKAIIKEFSISNSYAGNLIKRARKNLGLYRGEPKFKSIPILLEKRKQTRYRHYDRQEDIINPFGDL